MKLGEFITRFSHNNLVRLLYKIKGGEELVLENWDDVSMDWQINKGKGKFRHFVDNEVLSISSILVNGHYPEAINIVIERKDNQPYITESESGGNFTESE